jgi:hypothetical protein
VSQPNYCLSLNSVDEYVKFVPCNDNSPDQTWFTAQNPFDSNDPNPLTGADVGGERQMASDRIDLAGYSLRHVWARHQLAS